MIWESLSFLTGQLNSVLKNRLNTGEEVVILSNLVNPDGSGVTQDDNKIIVTLVKTEPESMPTPQAMQKLAQGRSMLNLNIFVMFSAFSKAGNYPESLKLLSAVIHFFQSKKVFTPQNSPGLDRQIDRIHFEMEKMEFMEQSNLWTSLGAKYMPSVVYRMRMLSFTDDSFTAPWPVIKGLDGDTQIERDEV